MFTYRRQVESFRKKHCLLARAGVLENNAANSYLNIILSNSSVGRPCLVRSAHTCLMDHVINDTLPIVTGCLRPTPSGSL